MTTALTLDCGMTISIDGHETDWECIVTYEHIPGTRGFMRGEPDEPDTCVVYRVTGHRLKWDEATKRHTPDSEVTDITPLLSKSQIELLSGTALADHQERMSPEREPEMADE